jgi:glyceraldehyde 3-phosphate dehydrogenase
MPIRAAINGFGRIGRQVYRAIRKHYPNQIRVVAVNDVGHPEMMTHLHLLKYDINHGRFPGGVHKATAGFVADGADVQVLAQPDPRLLPWEALGVDVVIEATGLMCDASKARAHIDGGASKVIITAPAKNEDLTVVLGVNDHGYDPRRHHVLSNASCTTNGLAPVAKVLSDRFGIEKGILTTVHSHTNSQRLLDLEAANPRDTRTAAMSIVPSQTGAAKALDLVIPELKGKFTEMALRVPTSTVSVIDFTAQLSRSVTVEEVNAAMKDYADGPMRGILAYSDEPLVSSDLKGNPHSAIFSGIDTLVIGGDLVKVVAWYDNEGGYCVRVADLVAYVAGERRASQRDHHESLRAHGGAAREGAL